MAKSMRSKVKRSFRSKKRETGVYAATEAARLQRLNAKLASVTKKDKDGDVPLEGTEEEGDLLEGENTGETATPAALMELDSDPKAATENSQKISTHGPRGSRRDEWRKSKGLVPRPKPSGMNRQGGIAGRFKSGRSQRRR